ncbi:hypothetical protein JCM9803A_00370 [Rhodococcus erythropolis]
MNQTRCDVDISDVPDIATLGGNSGSLRSEPGRSDELVCPSQSGVPVAGAHTLSAITVRVVDDPHHCVLHVSNLLNRHRCYAPARGDPCIQETPGGGGVECPKVGHSTPSLSM